MAFKGRIMSGSPYYVTVTGTTAIISATMNIYIWEDDSSARPSTPTYTITKNALTTTSINITFEISKLITDFFKHAGNAYDITPNNFIDALWVETDIDIVQVTQPNPTTVTDTYIAFEGYNYFEQGVNASEVYDSSWPTVPLIRVLEGNVPKIPIYLSDVAGDGIWQVITRLNGVAQETIDYTVKGTSLFAYDRFQYFVPSILPIDSIELYYDATNFISVSVEYIDECKYTPKVVQFLNKEGLLQEMTMFKVNKENIRITKDSYKHALGNVTGNVYGYDTGGHRIKDFNVEGSESIILNTGFIQEIENAVIKQLLLSEDVWIDQVPVNITQNNLEYLTRINDKLINYTLSFDYAYSVMNNV